MCLITFNSLKKTKILRIFNYQLNSRREKKICFFSKVVSLTLLSDILSIILQEYNFSFYH
jgi:hypothetical protein